MRRWTHKVVAFVPSRGTVSNPFRAGGEALATVEREGGLHIVVSNPFRAGGEALDPQGRGVRAQPRGFKPLQSGR